jgi:hypothetical protein
MASDGVMNRVPFGTARIGELLVAQEAFLLRGSADCLERGRKIEAMPIAPSPLGKRFNITRVRGTPWRR